MEGQQGEKDKRKPKCHPVSGWCPSSTILTVVVMVGVLSVVAVVLSYHHYHSTSTASTMSFNNLVEGWLTPPKRYTKTWSTAYNFSDDVAKLCAGNPRRLPPYGGLPSFFAALLKPDAKFCFAWLKFGGELNFINKMISQNGDQCVNGLYGSKYVCFNPEYRMNEDPCLVYAFSHPTENQFEKDMELFSCQVHSFVSYKGLGFDRIQRSKFYIQHPWILSDDHRDERVDVQSRYDDTVFGRHLYHKINQYRPLDFIITSLAHERKEIKFVKSDIPTLGNLLLKQIVKFRNEVDIRQVAVVLSLPLGDDTNGFRKIYEIFEGLACAGYKFVRVEPVTIYRKTIHVKETNQSYHPAFTVNFIKDLNFSP